MKYCCERTVGGGSIAVLIPEAQEDLDEIERLALCGEVDTSASFGDCRAEVHERLEDADNEADTEAEGAR